jgi:glycosyltransferase involved in cell wall biosynthesis
MATADQMQRSPRAPEGDRGALVMCAAIPWSFHRNRQQELAERLSEFLPVIYVEPPRRTRVSPWHESGGLRRIKGDCYVLSPSQAVPGDRLLSSVNRRVQRRVADAVDSALSHLGFGCSVLWIDRIESAPLLDHFPAAFAVYDCVDEQWTFGRLRRPRHLCRLEKMVASRSHLTIASSNRLRQRLSAIAPQVELIPNGCDFEHFSRATDTSRCPSDIPSDGAAVIGFVGGVTRRALDHRLLRHAFAALRDCRFVFVGSYDGSSERAIAREPNATLLGARDYTDIPSYLASFDVAIIPYVVGGQIDYVYPKKLHEYLAAGKPVVATDLPELRSFEGTIRIGRSPDEFVQKIEECLQENADAALSRRLAAERMAVAQANTWEHRVDRIVELLDAGLPNEGLGATPHLRTAHHA